MVERRLKKMMVTTAGLNSRPNTEAPRVPSENVDVVVLAASHIHIQSDKRWVWFLSLGRTRSIPRDSTPSSRSTIFHNWGGVRSQVNSKVKGNVPCQRHPCFSGHHPRNRAVHAFQSRLQRLPCCREIFRYPSRGQSSQRKYATELSRRRGWGAHATRRGIQVTIYSSPARNAWHSVAGWERTERKKIRKIRRNLSDTDSTRSGGDHQFTIATIVALPCTE